MRTILEVWDYRLSTAEPLNYRGQIPVEQEDGSWKLEDYPNWVACVYDQGERGEPLEIHDTGVPVEKGDLHDGKGLDACFKFYRSVRDNYSREDIEELKPEVAVIRKFDIERQRVTDAQNDAMKAAKAAKKGGKK